MNAKAQNNTFPNSGNAGVGTTNPGSKFEVVGSTRMKGKLVVDSLAKFKEDVQILGDLKIKSLEDTALNYNRLLGINQNGKIISYPDLKIKPNSLTIKRIYTSRIMPLPGDSLVYFGDSTIVINSNSHSIYNDQQSVIKGLGIGSPPVYINGNLLGGSIGYAPYSLALGGNAIVTNQGTNAIAMGYSMSNGIPYSLMVGFAPPNGVSGVGPTLYIGPKDANFPLGQVGIGTSAPHCEFHIKGHNGNTDLCIESQNGTQWDWASSDNGSLTAFSPSFNIAPLSIASSGQVNLTQASNTNYALSIENGGGEGNCVFIKGGAGGGAGNNYNLLLAQTYAGLELFKINGKTGTTWARKITVTQSAFADYVFDDSYTMMKLPELEQYVKQNKHLPNIPSEKEIREKGMDLGEMQKLQMEKIEELTLYIIQQQKEIEALRNLIKQQK